jgi:hypothetical protein
MRKQSTALNTLEFVQTAVAAETHLAEEMLLQLRWTEKVVPDRTRGDEQANWTQNIRASSVSFKSINEKNSIEMPPPPRVEWKEI